MQQLPARGPDKKSLGNPRLFFDGVVD